MSLKSQLESLLWVAAKPMSFKSLAKILGIEIEAVKTAIEELRQEGLAAQRGLLIAIIDDQAQLITNPANAQLIEGFLKEEISGELTRPSLETLTIIAYRGPITKPELEMIRGVNCSLILRNLLLRGLVEEKPDGARGPKYSVTFDFLRFLGVTRLSELPDYQKLSSHEIVDKWLQSQTNQANQAV